MYFKKFSHIYIENQASEYQLTQGILKSFPEAEIIPIRNYKDVFNRPGQNFQEQKNSMKIILAVKKDNFVYEGSLATPNFGFENFYYNTLILNCVYNCDYCYLQGMFSSANIVIFVNLEDFFSHTRELVSQRGKTYLCLSYETDLLAMERYVPFASRWIEEAYNVPDLTIEIRTKSSDFKKIEHLKPAKNIILAWTISPENIIKEFEDKTPTLSKRLESVKQAIDKGWNVRLCFDPILYTKNWKEEYCNCIQTTFETIPASKVYDITIGVFRINKDYLQNIRKMRQDSPLLYHPFEYKEGMKTYSDNLETEMKTTLTSEIEKYIKRDKIFV